MTSLLLSAGVIGLCSSRSMSDGIVPAFNKARQLEGWKSTALNVAGCALITLSSIAMLSSVFAIAYSSSIYLMAGLVQVMSPEIAMILTTCLVTGSVCILADVGMSYLIERFDI